MIGHGEVSRVRDTEDPPLYTLAENMLARPGGFDAYDYAKSVWLGNPDRTARRRGEHPWPTREHHGETYVYSVPVLASVSPKDETLFFIAKDNWKEPDDPNAWLVAQSNLVTGEEQDLTVIASSVDKDRNLWLQLAPSDGNMNRHDYVRAQLDETYMADRAELWWGRYLSSDFEDYEALESMIRFVDAVRQAHNENEFLERRKAALGYEQGRRAVGYHLAA